MDLRHRIGCALITAMLALAGTGCVPGGSTAARGYGIRSGTARGMLAGEILAEGIEYEQSRKDNRENAIKGRSNIIIINGKAYEEVDGEATRVVPEGFTEEIIRKYGTDGGATRVVPEGFTEEIIRKYGIKK